MLEAVMGVLAAFDLSALGGLLEAGRMSGGSEVDGLLEAGLRGP